MKGFANENPNPPPLNGPPVSQTRPPSALLKSLDLRTPADCDMLCRAAGALDHLSSRYVGEMADRTRELADEVYRVAVILRTSQSAPKTPGGGQ